jgi:hypothetical protein
MPKEEKKPVSDDLQEEATVNAIIETLNLFASIEHEPPSAEDANAAETTTPPAPSSKS